MTSTRNRSPLSTHYRTTIGGVDVLAHKAIVRDALAAIESGEDATLVAWDLPLHTFTEWETGFTANLDLDEIVRWFEWTEPDGTAG